MIATPARSIDSVPATAEESPTAPVVRLYPNSYRWWRLAVGSPPSDRPPVLMGVASDVVWPSSVTSVPCWAPLNAQAGPCACGLHAGAEAEERARSLASVVVGGSVRVLSTGHGDPRRPEALVAIEGPLRLVISCGGPADGFSLDRCDEPALWVAGATSAGGFCRRHRKAIPRSVRNQRERATEFEKRVAAGLGRRYATDVVIGRASSERPEDPPVRRLFTQRLRPSGARARSVG